MTLHGHFDPWLAVLSFLIAAIGSYLSLLMAPVWAGHLAMEESRRVRGVLPSGVALGLTIWAMHFTGMAAFHIHGISISYDWSATILSLGVAVTFTCVGFATLTLLREPVEAVVVAGVPMGSGILAMHFLGMMAMSGSLRMSFQPWGVIGAALIALIASTAALWMTTIPAKPLRRLGAALVMAMAICGMHYAGMAAAHFSVRDTSGAVQPG